MIPKIFHHIWMGKNTIPHTCLDCLQNAKNLHPEFEFKLWRDSDIEHLMSTEFAEYYDEFYKLPRSIMKIDMFRYFLMYKYGGVYTDLDYFFLKPYDIFDYSSVIPCNREDENGDPSRLGNCIFASKPRFSFWKHLMDSLFAIDRSQTDYTKDSQVDSDELGTGPVFVYHMWKKYPNGIYVPVRRLFHPQTNTNTDYIVRLREQGVYGMHICTGLWRNNKL